MQLSKVEYFENYAKNSNHCSRITLISYEYDFNCVSCRYNIIKRKHELPKIQRRKIYFINRLKHAEHKFFLIV